MLAIAPAAIRFQNVPPHPIVHPSIPTAHWALHAACLAACWAIFLGKALPGMVTDVNLLQGTEVFYLATTDPAAVAGGYFDQVNANVQNVPYLAYGALRHWFDQPTSAMMLHCGIAAVLIAGVYALAYTLASSVSIAVAVTSILVNAELIGYPCVGANGLPSQTTGYSYLFLGIALLGVRFLVTGRPYGYAALLPLAFLGHMPQGLLAFVVLLPAAWLLSGKNGRFLAVHVGSMTALIGGFYLYQRLHADVTTSSNSDLWFHYLHLLNCGHLYVDYGVGSWVGFFAFAATMLAGLALSAARPASRPLLLPTIVSGLALLTLVQVFIYVLPLRTVYLIMPLRVTNLLSALVLIHVLVWLLETIASNVSLLSLAPVALGLAAAAASGYLGAMLLAAAACLLSACMAKGRLRAVGLVSALLIASLCYSLGAEGAQQWQAFVASRRASLLALLGVAAVGYAILMRINRWPAARQSLLAGFAAVLIAASAWVPNLVDYTQPQFQTLTAQIAEFQRIGRWVREHTASGEIAILPPDCTMPVFEVVAHRGSLLQFTKVGWVYSAPHLLDRFDRVLQDFGIDLRTYHSHGEIWTRPRASWNALSSERFRELSAKYGASYLVTYADHSLDLPVALRGEHFVVYETRSPRVANRPLTGAIHE